MSFFSIDDDTSTTTEIDIEFITDCIHQLSNEIPSTGIILIWYIIIFQLSEIFMIAIVLAKISRVFNR